MATKYSAKNKFIARDNDFEVISTPKKTASGKTPPAKPPKKPTAKK